MTICKPDSEPSKAGDQATQNLCLLVYLKTKRVSRIFMTRNLEAGRDFHENFSNMQKILEKLILVKYKK